MSTASIAFVGKSVLFHRLTGTCVSDNAEIS